MLGSIIGDIIGSIYEFHNVKRTDFNLFSKDSRFTDDSTMTIAVAKWLVEDSEHSKRTLVETMQKLGRSHPDRGYGGNFRRWLFSRNPLPYNSWGNGSAMRVSPVGLYAKKLSEALELAKISAEVTHNHPEGIKGAQAIAASVFLAKEGLTKSFIKKYITRKFGYNLDRSINDIRENYTFDVSCQGSVPEAIIAFLEGNSFEEVIRLAVSIGGDSDTIACMAGAIAACYYTVSLEIDNECRKRFHDDTDLLQVVDEFEEKYAHSSCFKTMMPDDNPRTYWEGTSSEASLLGLEQKTATFADLVLRDHSIAACGAQYLYSKNAVEDVVRKDDMRFTLFRYGSALLESLFEMRLNDSNPDSLKTVIGHWQQKYAIFHDFAECANTDYTTMGKEFDRLVEELYANDDMRPCLCNYILRNSRVTVASTSYRPAFTPDKISRLGYDEIFVFGSNLRGMHAGGAARVAVNQFGAIMGQGVGLQGQSYAIPTMQGGVETIKPYVDDFIRFAKEYQNLVFYVTRIGCGIAGFKDKEIAPLFSEARGIKNIILPKSFCEVLELQNGLYHDLLTHAHGITKTFADVLVELNKKEHFTNAESALDSLDHYFDRFRKVGDEIAFLAIRILYCELNVRNFELFEHGVLNTNTLRERVFNNNIFIESYDKAYLSYCKERLCNLISYLNTFRRYKTVEQVRSDLQELKVTSFSHCSPNNSPYFFSIESGYPTHFFSIALQKHWDEISSSGILDNTKMMEVMFNRHERGIRKYGLEAVIKHDYESDGPCHPEVYFPKKVGTGPIYVRIADRKFIRSCGEGKGPHSVPNEYEFHLALQLLEKDKNYIEVSQYFIPRSDYTLPVFDWWSGLISFDSDEEKMSFIKEVMKNQQD